MCIVVECVLNSETSYSFYSLYQDQFNCASLFFYQIPAHSYSPLYSFLYWLMICLVFDPLVCLYWTVIGPSRVCVPAQRRGHYTRHYFYSSSSLPSSALSWLGLWLADDFKGKPPHWLLGVNWNIGLSQPGRNSVWTVVYKCLHPLSPKLTC